MSFHFKKEHFNSTESFGGSFAIRNVSHAIVNMLQNIINIANNAKDKRHEDFTDFINAAVDVTSDESIQDPSPGILVAWRTAGSGSPGPGFTLHTTILGNDFYYIPKA